MADVVLEGWPDNIPMPARLRQLVSGPSSFADFELDASDDGFLEAQNGGDDGDLAAVVKQKLPYFGRDGGGGRLMLWTNHPDPARWPVIHYDSEGQIAVVGEHLDDFLGLLGASWTEAGALDGSDEVKAWVRGLGIVPPAQPEERQTELRAHTLAFLRWYTEAHREVCARLHPERPLVLEAIPGQALGPVRLGAAKSEVDALLGEHTLASWQGKDEPTFSAYYRHSPFAVSYARPANQVASVGLYTTWVRVRFPDGFEPLRATVPEARSWLQRQGAACEVDLHGLVCPALGLRLFCTGVDRDRLDWVERVDLGPLGAVPD